ncbi:hypothetical protein [Nocardia sp. NRRL S-836]|uniref:hypothetical protein n=1 Tax=Nocardia sp. NRRL S-836 TaxID=1519492 RepID=UPI000A9ABFDD|nr:hypothetical protein [Nocardia sp. NRRL S-836]
MIKETRVWIYPTTAPAYTEERARLIGVFQQAPELARTSVDVRAQSGLPDSTVHNLLRLFKETQWLYVDPETTGSAGASVSGRLWRLTAAGARSEWGAEHRMVISESRRRLMVELLREPSPRSPMDLATRLDAPPSTVAGHLTRLRLRGWLTVTNTEATRTTKQNLYSLNETGRSAVEEALRLYAEAQPAPAVISRDGIKMTPPRVAILEELMRTPHTGHYALQLATALQLNRSDVACDLRKFFSHGWVRRVQRDSRKQTSRKYYWLTDRGKTLAQESISEYRTAMPAASLAQRTPARAKDTGRQ